MTTAMDNQDLITKLLTARENMIREFDDEAYREHENSPWCPCDPYVFDLEGGTRAYRHKRES